MRINITINDETIRDMVSFAVQDLVEYEQIQFESEKVQEEFISDCAENIIDKFLAYANYYPNYENEVLDFYEIYF